MEKLCEFLLPYWSTKEKPIMVLLDKCKKKKECLPGLLLLCLFYRQL